MRRWPTERSRTEMRPMARAPWSRRWPRNWPLRRGSIASGFARWRTRSRCGPDRRGKALFHPIRVALTGRAEGPELDLAVPAIDRGAELPADCRSSAGSSVCRERAAAFVSGA